MKISTPTPPQCRCLVTTPLDLARSFRECPSISSWVPLSRVTCASSLHAYLAWSGVVPLNSSWPSIGLITYLRETAWSKEVFLAECVWNQRFTPTTRQAPSFHTLTSLACRLLYSNQQMPTDSVTEAAEDLATSHLIGHHLPTKTTHKNNAITHKCFQKHCIKLLDPNSNSFNITTRPRSEGYVKSLLTKASQHKVSLKTPTRAKKKMVSVSERLYRQARKATLVETITKNNITKDVKRWVIPNHRPRKAFTLFVLFSIVLICICCRAGLCHQNNSVKAYEQGSVLLVFFIQYKNSYHVIVCSAHPSTGVGTFVCINSRKTEEEHPITSRFKRGERSNNSSVQSCTNEWWSCAKEGKQRKNK